MRILLISLFLLACNPVKQVLKDKERFDKIAKEVILAGYCVNDTIIQTKSDTTVKIDTLYEYAEINNDIYCTDTLRIPIKKTIVKTLTIKDTVTKVVTDNARINALEANLAVQIEKTNEYKDKAKSRLFWLILLLIAILLRILYKPILKIIAWHS